MTRTTRDGFRPHYDQKVRLIELAPEQPHDRIPQAVVGDVVRVYRIISGGRGGMLWLVHWGGTNCATQSRGPETYLAGTMGVWEEVPDNRLSLYRSGTRLEQLAAEDRIAVLVEAVLGLMEEERRAVLEKLMESGR